MMHQHNHKFSYDEDERRKRQNPESILSLIGLRKDMVFIDLGANDGFFSIPASSIVGNKGQIYAVDIDKEALYRLADKASQKGLTWACFGLIFLLAYPYNGRLLSPFVLLAALPYFLAMASDLKYCGYKRSDVLRIYLTS